MTHQARRSWTNPLDQRTPRRPCTGALIDSACALIVSGSALCLTLGACNKQEAEGHAPPATATAQKPAEDEHAAAAAAQPAGDIDPAKEAERIAGKVSFIQPQDGAAVAGKVQEGKVAVPVKMAVEGMTVKPAGPLSAGTGHHHIILDGDVVPIGQPVPQDSTHLHFGKGQTETVLHLSPGKHKLTMQFADGLHRSYGPKWSSSVNIEVKAEAHAEAEH